MTVDDSSSADASLIDDDLVEALGFEPVTTVDVDDEIVDHSHGGHSSGHSSGHSNNGARVNGSGDVDVDETPTDAPVEPVDDDIVIVDEPVEGAVDDDAVDRDAVDRDAVDHDAAGGGAEIEAAAVPETDVDTAVEQAVDPDPDDVMLEAPSSVAVVDDGEIDDDVWNDGIVLRDDPDLATESVIDLDRLEGDDRDIPFDGDLDTDEAATAEAEIPLGLAEPEDVFADSGSSYGPHDTQTLDETVADVVPAPAVTRAGRRKTRKRLRARKSRRVIKHIDPWSVLTFSVLFHMCVFGALLLSSVLVWNAATASGTVENVESFIQELGDYETFEINADVMFRAAVVIAGMLTLASSVLVVLLTVVFNLISDLIGGIRVTVIEEETVRVPLVKGSKNE